MTKAILTQARLKELVSYCPKTGLFTWINNRSKHIKAGSVAGTGSHEKGYCSLRIDGSGYYQHRLVWLYVYGYFPTQDIDHINGCPGDNSISNLREATRSQNLFNTARVKTNTSGFKGVTWSNRDKRWCAQITVKGVTKNLGSFKKVEDAAIAYSNSAKELHGYFYTTRS